MSDKSPKLILTAFSDEKFKSEVAKYTVPINPKSYHLTEGVAYNDLTTLGASGTDLKYNHHTPAELSITITIDVTGAVPDSPKDLPEELDKLREMLIGYSGDTHEPNYVMVNWGTLSFQGRVVAMDTTYKLFADDGKPLRAEIELTFHSSIATELRSAKEGKSSPDLTHVREVMAGDTLPAMTKAIYGDPRYYIEVAKANELEDFRNLQPGMHIFFPPLAKTDV